MNPTRDTSGVDNLLSQAQVLDSHDDSLARGRGRGRGRGRMPVDQNGMLLNLAGGRGRGTFIPTLPAAAVVQPLNSSVNSYVLPRELVDFHAHQNANARIPVLLSTSTLGDGQADILTSNSNAQKNYIQYSII